MASTSDNQTQKLSKVSEWMGMSAVGHGLNSPLGDEGV
jgi:hypothetical protein